MSVQDMEISRRLAENLEAQGYREPTEVQMGSLPLLLGSDEEQGLSNQMLEKSKKDRGSEVDLLTVAPTGSGKTLAFMIPIIHGLMEQRRPKKKEAAGEGEEGCNVQALVIAPTHELVDQIVQRREKARPRHWHQNFCHEKRHEVISRFARPAQVN